MKYQHLLDHMHQTAAPPHGGETALLTALGDKREQPDVQKVIK